MKKYASILSNNEYLKLFRQKAETILNNKAWKPDSLLSGMEVQELLHELQVFQIELEMQNDELRSSHESLELERKKFLSLYDLAPVGYFILNQFGVIEEVNTTGSQMIGAPKAILLKQRLQEFIATESIKNFYAFIRKLQNTGQKQNCQLWLKASTGQSYYTQIEGVGVRNASGDKQFYIAAIDITERMEAEQRLYNANERLKMTLEASATGTWEIDLQKRTIFMDDYCYTIYGYKPWEFDGKYETFFEAIHPDDADKMRSAFETALKESTEIDLEYRIKNGSALKYLRIRGHIINKDKDNNKAASHFVGIMIDITESKKQESNTEGLRLNQERNINKAVLQVQENERKRISESLHDSVSQLLYAIRLNFQNYKEVSAKKDDFAAINDLIDQAIKETRNISFELAPSILTDFGLREGIKEMIKRISMPQFVVKSQLSILKARLDPNLEISVFRIVQELLNNSIKHGRATEAHVKINTINGHINILVNDNGIGFNVKDSDYLLKGSGLRSIKNRVNLYNGSMDIKSTVDKGTSVYIILKHDN